MKAINWGYCTKNENGLIQVSWELPQTFFGKLFNKRFKFVYEKKGNDWFCKDSGLLVIDFKIHNNIREVEIDFKNNTSYT